MKTTILLLISLLFFANSLLAQSGLSYRHLQVDFTVINPVNKEVKFVNHTYALKEIRWVGPNDSLLPYLEMRSALISKDLDAIKAKFGEPVFTEITPEIEKRIYRKGLMKVEVEIDRSVESEIDISFYQNSDKVSRATSDQVGEIEVGKTSNGEIIEVFGNPTMVRFTDGKEEWIYKMKSGMLRIEFDLESGKVRDFKYHSK